MKKLELEATVENIEKVTDFINAELEAAGCPARAQIQIDVAIDEIFSNIANYAYAPGTGGAVVVYELLTDPRAVEITFFDRGMPFNPLENTDPDVTLPAEERQVGGLGVFLVKKTMDDVSYEYRDGQNILRIMKKI